MFSGKVQSLALLNLRDIKTDFRAAPNLINGNVWLRKSIRTDLCLVGKYSTYLKSWIVYDRSFLNTIRFTSQKHVWCALLCAGTVPYLVASTQELQCSPNVPRELYENVRSQPNTRDWGIPGEFLGNSLGTSMFPKCSPGT